MVFNIQIAGKVITIHSIFREVYELCKDYEVTSDSVSDTDLTVRTSFKDLLSEKKRSKDDHRYSFRYLETLSVYRKIAEFLPQYDTILMHGSVVAVNEEGYLFTAKSGVGKTTHTNLWLKNITGSYVVNGDKPLIRINEEAVSVSGTPWAGKERLNRNVTVPLKVIYLLERGEKNQINKVPAAEAFPVLLQQAYKPVDEKMMAKTVHLLKEISQHVQIYRLQCNISDEAAILAYHSVCKGEER